MVLDGLALEHRAGTAPEARRSMEADVGRALDWLIRRAEGGA